MTSQLKKVVALVAAIAVASLLFIQLNGSGHNLVPQLSSSDRITLDTRGLRDDIGSPSVQSDGTAADLEDTAGVSNLIQLLTKNLTNLEKSLHDRDLAFSQKLDDIRNIALADLEIQDTMEDIATNFSKFQHDIVDSVRDKRLQKPSNEQIVESPKPLDRKLKILIGSASLLAMQQKIEETDPNSMQHRDMLFGGRGRDVNIKNENLFDSCPPGCELLTDASRFNESDVVIIYGGSTAYRDLVKQDLRITRAFPEQRFVFFFFEQPHNFAPTDLSIINERVGINWTLHYQQDATVFWPYGTYRPRATPISIAPNYGSGKKRKVIWVVSRCATLFQHREHYIAELIKYIDIDVYGKCIDNTPSRVPMDVNKVAEDYKFFISFENGDCDDYITEKFFRYAKEVAIVPIVLGRRNHYEQLAPDRSYIQADQFDSPKQLAAYLHALDKDEALYQQYFQWKKYFIMDYMPRPVCRMCNIFREKWNDPEQINMHKYHGYQRCWKANRNLVPDYLQKMTSLGNYTYTDPWTQIKELNSRDKPLRFT